MDAKVVLASVAMIALVVLCVSAVGEAQFKAGAIAAYKHEIVCANVKQLDRPSEWQCKEVVSE